MTLSALKKKRLSLDRRYSLLKSGLEVLKERVTGTETMLGRLRLEIAETELAIKMKDEEAR